jgi:hypothetical protein
LASQPTIGALATTGSLVSGRWGYGLGADASTPPTSWKGISTSAALLDSYGGITASRQKSLFLGVKVDFLTPACSDYETVITLTAIGN